MKKIYDRPEAELVYVTSVNVLATSVPGDDEFTDKYDTSLNRRPWGNVWNNSGKQ